MSLDLASDLHEAFENYVKWETISDYRLEESGKKVDVEKRSCIHSLPQTMIVHLKRFVFNYDTFLQEKLNSEFKFPTRMNFEPYTAEGLARREAAKEARAAPSPQEQGDASTAQASTAQAGSHASQADEDLAPPAHPLEHYEYELAGVVIHSGTADTGHYYSFIKDRSHPDGGWLRFDDSIVTKFDPAELNTECFGGLVEVKEVNKYGYESRVQKERVKNAYMLIYDRVWKGGEDGSGGGSGGSAGSGDQMTQELAVERKIPDNIRQTVWEDNRTFFFDRRVFHPDFFNFVAHILSKVSIPPCLEYTTDQGATADKSFNYIMCGTKFVLETVARAQDNGVMANLVEHLCALYEKNVPVAKTFLEYYTSNINLIVDLVLRCPDATVRSCVQKLLNTILRTIGAMERTFWWEQTEIEVPVEPKDGEPPTTQVVLRYRSVALNFMEAYLKHFGNAEKLWSKFEQYWEVLQHWCADGEQEQLFLIKQGCIWKMVDIYLGDRWERAAAIIRRPCQLAAAFLIDEVTLPTVCSPRRSPLQYNQKKVKMGRANLRPKFEPLVACVCRLAVTAKGLSQASHVVVDEKDRMMVRRRHRHRVFLSPYHLAVGSFLMSLAKQNRPVQVQQPSLYEKALSNKHAPEDLAAMAVSRLSRSACRSVACLGASRRSKRRTPVAVSQCCLAVNNRDFTDMLIGQIQNGVDQKDYDDLQVPPTLLPMTRTALDFLQCMCMYVPAKHCRSQLAWGATDTTPSAASAAVLHAAQAALCDRRFAGQPPHDQGDR